MRQIKFRAWSQEHKTYYYSDDEAYFLKHQDGKLGLYEDVGFYRKQDQGSQIVSDELEQFTGLQDKNGVDIYENDLIEFDELIFEVKWNIELAGYELYHNNEPSDTLYGCEKYMEVIGNTHESKNGE